jgi:hypothetical protein
MQTELTYQVPYERLAKLSRSAGRKAFWTVRLLTWLLVAVYLAALVGLIFYSNTLEKWAQRAGIPFGTAFAFVGVAALTLTGFMLLRRLNIAQIKSRVDFNRTIRLTKDDGGVRIATDGIEYYLKWQGISQMLLEYDGVVVAHGNLFFLVPDAAFADAGQRRAFIRDVYGHLSEKARAISEKHVRAVLASGEVDVSRLYVGS